MKFGSSSPVSLSSGKDKTRSLFTSPQDQPKTVRVAEEGREIVPVANEILKRVADKVLETIDPAIIMEIPKKQLLDQIMVIVHDVVTKEKMSLNSNEEFTIASSIIDDMVGHGPLDALLDDEDVTEIMVNGPHKIFIEKAGKTMLSNVRFRDEDHLKTIAKRIARAIGRRIDEQSPYVDARLLDGSRVNMVTTPIALDGTSISIRKFPKERLQLSQLQAFGALSSEMARFIQAISTGRCNIIVSGGTSSGKTTLLNSLSDFIRPTERVVTIEDSAELKLDIPNLVRLETRTSTAEAGSKAVTQRDLVANSLRMRPDRIILGEVRREEAFDLLQAMGTGHDGSMGTLHSNDPRDTCRRLENMILMGGFELPTRVVRSQIVSSVEFIIHAARGADGKRRVTHITEIVGMEGETIIMQDIFTFEFNEDGPGGEHVAHPVNLRCAGKLKEYGQFDAAMAAILDAPRSRKSS